MSGRGWTPAVGAPGTRRAAQRTRARRHVLGVADDDERLSWVPARDGRVLLVCGPHRSGRTNALRVLAASIAAGGRAVAVVTRAQRWPAWVPGTAWRSSAQTTSTPWSTRGAETLHWRSSSTTPTSSTTHRSSGPLHEVLDLVDRDDGLFVAVTSTSALASRFRGLDVAVARRRTALLLAPSSADGDLVGAARLHGIPSLPGRGVFVSGGVATELQVYLAPASGVGVDAREPAPRGWA